MYQPKTFFEVAADMIETARAASDRVTDWNVGSVARTLLEGQAMGLEDFYQALNLAIQEAIPASLYAAFDFQRLPAAIAHGKIRVTIAPLSTDFTLTAGPNGASFSTAGGEANFVLDEDLTIPAGQTVGEAAAVCTTSGVVGNVPANTITLFTGASLAVESVTNPLSFSMGSDGESDQAMKARFVAYIASIARATPASLEYAARSQKRYDAEGNIIEAVERVAVQEYAGYVRLFIYSGSGASDELVEQVQRVIDGYYDDVNEVIVGGYRAAGVFVLVGAMATKTVDIAATVDLLPGYAPNTAMDTAVRTAIDYAIRTHPSGQALTVARMQNAILAVPGVQDVEITPAQSIPCAAAEALLPGTVSLTWT